MLSLPTCQTGQPGQWPYTSAYDARPAPLASGLQVQSSAVKLVIPNMQRTVTHGTQTAEILAERPTRPIGVPTAP